MGKQQNNLKSWRIKRGLTQAQLAEKIGTKQPRIADYENHHLGMSVTTLIELCKALRVSAHYIIPALDQRTHTVPEC